MDSNKLRAYLAAMDEHLQGDAALVVYGSAAFILLGETDRTTLDIDVAAAYSVADYPDLERAAREAGLAMDPDETSQEDHIEWIGPLRLCLPEPDDATSLTLWRGRRLTVRTVSAAELAASKLVRYDAIDAADVRFLCSQAGLSFEDVSKAARRLPARFGDDPIVRENMEALRADMDMWRRAP